MNPFNPFSSSTYAENQHLINTEKYRHFSNIMSEQQSSHFHQKVVNALQIVETGIPGVLGNIAHANPKCVEALRFLLDGVMNGIIDSDWLAGVTASDAAKVSTTSFEAQQGSNHLNRNVSVISKNSMWSNLSNTSGDTAVPIGSHDGWNHLEQPLTIEETHEMDFSPGGFSTYQKQNQEDVADRMSFLSNATYPEEISQMQSSYQNATAFMPETPSFIPIVNTIATNNGQPILFDDVTVAEREPSQAHYSPSYAHNLEMQHYNLDHAPQHQFSTSVSGIPSLNVPLHTKNQRIPSGMVSASRQNPSIVGESQKPAEFHSYDPQQTKTPQAQSLCPQCHSKFEKRTEFVKHTKGEHDKPVIYTCCHHLSRRNTKQCPYSHTSAHIFIRHHNGDHKQCKKLKGEDLDSDVTSACVHKQHKPKPKRVWGCWCCEWVTSDGLDWWAKHHFEEHQGCSKKDMSTTWLMKSLLSQKSLQKQWHHEVEQVERNIGQKWDPQWNKNSEDPVLAGVIHQLETGYWYEQDFNIDPVAKKAVIQAALNAAGIANTTSQQATQDETTGSKRTRDNSPPSGLRRVKSILCPQRSKSTAEQSVPDLPIAGNNSLQSEQPSGTPCGSMPIRRSKSRPEGHNDRLAASFGATYGNDTHMIL